MAKLKVYRTPAGFHDAYVAAPSQKAALAAWGSSANLFARGLAEQVTDPALIAAPLDRPGEVIRVARTMADATDLPPVKRRASKDEGRDGGRDESSDQASGTRKAAPSAKAKPKAKNKPKAKPAPKPKPKPSRAALDKAEAAIEAAEARHKAQRDALRREEQALAARRRALEKEQAEERTRLDRARLAARGDYEDALDAWRGD
ncbi:hypothetical protein [Sphingomonas sp.]|jgi:hypothetical protein|uniref:hypothetical protein n=1 Tax=Sphingomonas sp. TaxID=28214 RepID=UPI00260AB2EF|nr:hypothetical protein [Sphingomonas sp.]MDF2494335.1 hypothetical protein [Sphingomonas sp.]